MSAAAGLEDAVRDAVHEFEGRWGNLEHTVEVTAWRDGDRQIEVYHTRDGLEAAPFVIRCSTVLEPGSSAEHMEYVYRPPEIERVLAG